MSAVPAVGAFVLREDSVLLVRRARPPNAHRWSVPGGMVKMGETVEAAVVREVREECGVAVRPGGVFQVSDFVERDDRGRIRFHYVLIDVLCDFISGAVRPATDAENAAWLPIRGLHEYDVTETTLAAIRSVLSRRP